MQPRINADPLSCHKDICGKETSNKPRTTNSKATE